MDLLERKCDLTQNKLFAEALAKVSDLKFQIWSSAQATESTE
jgi:hypothetical protein